MAHTTSTVNTSGRGRFTRGYNAGTGTCQICGKRTQAGILRQQADLCDLCWEEAGMENEHQDGYHGTDQNGPNTACPMCREAATIAQALAEPDIAGLPTVEAAPAHYYRFGCCAAGADAHTVPQPPRGITGHAFTPWKTVPTRCNTCGKVAKRHAEVAPTATQAAAAEALATVDLPAKRTITTYRLRSKLASQRKYRTFAEYEYTGGTLAWVTFYDYKTQKAQQSYSIEAEIVASRVVSWVMDRPENTVLYTHYESAL